MSANSNAAQGLGNRSEHVLSMTGTAADVDAIVAAVIKVVANSVQARG